MKIVKTVKLENCGRDLAAEGAHTQVESTDTVPVILYYFLSWKNKKEPRINVALL